MVQASRSQSSSASAQQQQQQQQQQRAGQQSSQDVVQSLTELLAETYKLAFKTQLCRWNIEGPTFYTLYSRLGSQYKSLTKSANTIGNRIRAISPDSQLNLRQSNNLQQIVEQNNVPGSWQEIIQDLQNSHQQLAEQCQQAIQEAQSANDNATTYLLLKRANYHEKTVSKLHNVLAPQGRQARTM